MRELRLPLLAGLVVMVVMLAVLARWHEAHYSRRELALLRNRVEGLERAFIEDRMV